MHQQQADGKHPEQLHNLCIHSLELYWQIGFWYSCTSMMCDALGQYIMPILGGTVGTVKPSIGTQTACRDRLQGSNAYVCCCYEAGRQALCILEAHKLSLHGPAS